MGSKLTFKPFFKSYDFGDGFAYTQWAWQGQEIVAEIYRHTVDDGDVELTTYPACVGWPPSLREDASCLPAGLQAFPGPKHGRLFLGGESRRSQGQAMGAGPTQGGGGRWVM